MPYDLSEAFEAIENELIGSMMRNLKRHRAEETMRGFEWEQWQALQLRALEEYRRRNAEKFPPRFSKLNGQIDAMLKGSYRNGGTEQERKILAAIRRGFKGKSRNKPDFTGQLTAEGSFFGVNDRKLGSLIESVTHDMERAEYAVLRRAEDAYRQTIFNAHVYANTGSGTYEKAVDMATRDFLRAGLACVEYQNGSRHTLSDYADMAIRTANKRAYLQGEGAMRQEWNIPTVIMNKRSCPCPKCAPFVGMVFIDDVWSGGPQDGVSPVTGVRYPLLSEAIAQGLYHPRCKDSHSTYFEGISTPPGDSAYTAEELDALAQRYDAEQKQGYCQRQQQHYARLSRFSLDPDNQRMYGARAKAWGLREGQYRQFVHSLAGAENISPEVVASLEKPYIEVQDDYFKSATPGIGKLEFDLACVSEQHKRLYEDEVAFAKWLHETLGGDIHVFEEKNQTNGQKNPDYQWNGKLWDLKSPKSEKGANSLIRKGLQQIANNPGGIMLDFGNIDISFEKLQETIDKRMQWVHDKTVDVMIVAKGKIIKILRYKK